MKINVQNIKLMCALLGAMTFLPSAAQTMQRADSLTQTLSLKEKIGQLNQLNCNGVTPELLAAVERGEIGSFLNVWSAEDVNALQQAAMRGRHAIPLLVARDVIHGYHTIFPIPLGQAATFDPEVTRQGGRVAAIEATRNGIRWTFAPMLDIAHDPRWGRVAESLGEDPFLASVLGAAMVKGFQGDNLTDATSMAACAKHFVGYGAAEGGRDYNTTSIPSRVLRNIYLPSFQAAIDAGAMTVMSSFNANDGVPSTGNRHLLRDILRGEMGFKGLVVSDWNSVTEMIAHGFAADSCHAAELSLNAGLDMEMNSETFTRHLESLIKAGQVKMEDVDAAVRNVLAVKYELGLFDNPMVDLALPSCSYQPAHLTAARDAAAKSAVLLKNDSNLLPLSPRRRVAILGPMADAPREQLGTWIFDGQPEHTVTPLNVLSGKWEGGRIDYVYDPILSTCTSLDTTRFALIDKIMAGVDAAIVFVGEEARLSGEAHSLSNINLIGRQSELLRRVKAAGKPVVAVVMAGRPLTIERDLANVDAMLYSFHPGTMGGPALVDILFGRVNPSGRLPMTFVRETGQIPMYYNHENTGRPALGAVKTIYGGAPQGVQTSAGDVSAYLDSGNRPLFPFGYGLSYTQFTYAPATLSSTTLTPGDSIVVSTVVKNTGRVAGTEVVQLYVRDRVGSITRPVKELKGFQRVTLKPGEGRRVSFTIKPGDLSFVGLDNERHTEPGTFDLGIGHDSDAPLTLSFDYRE